MNRQASEHDMQSIEKAIGLVKVALTEYDRQGLTFPTIDLC